MKSLHRTHSGSFSIATFILVFSLFYSACTKDRQPPENALAVVGNRFITVDEFVRRMEMTPRPQVHQVNGHTGKRALLEMLIAEKLMALQAEEWGIAGRKEVQQQTEFIESQAVLRELYADDVLSKVRVSENEVRAAFQKMQKTLVIHFFHARKKDDAAAFRRLVTQTGSFAAALKSRYGKDLPQEKYTAQMTWGDVDAALEETAYNLPLQEISPVIRTSRGFFVIEVVDIRETLLPTEKQLRRKRSAIEKILRRRKADAVSDEYVREFMQGKDLKIKGRLFALLTEELEKRLRSAPDSAGLASIAPQETPAQGTGQPLHRLRDEPLVTFNGGHFTLGEILQGLRLRDPEVDRRSSRHIRASLRRHIFDLARDLLLAREAYRRKLQNRPPVRAEVREWQDYFCYHFMADSLNLRRIDSPAITFSPQVRRLLNTYPVTVDTARLSEITLTSIPVMAVRPGQWNQLVVPPWPDRF